MFFIGIDVSKATHDCSLLHDVASNKRRGKSVANSRAGIHDLLVWCAKEQIDTHELHATLKGTGVYHEQAVLALSDAGVTVSIVNPAQFIDFGRSLGIRTKTDCVDSLILACYGALLKPKLWTPPAQEARIFQALLARRKAIAQDLQCERNRMEKQLTKLQHDIDDHINEYPTLKADRDLSTSIPAIGPQIGNHML